MRFLLTLFIVLALVSVTAYLALNQPGYVLLGYGKTSIEMPLFDFVLLLALGALFLYVVARLIASLLNLPYSVTRLAEKRKRAKARKELSEGLLQMAVGNWEKAEKLVTRSANVSDQPVVNYLVAAHAAQRQKSPLRRDKHLQEAIKSDKHAELAVGLAQAELQTIQKEYEEALATLHRLQTLAPRHPFIHKLLARLYFRMKNFDALYKLLPRLRKDGKLSEDEIRELEFAVASQLMNQAGAEENLDKLNQLWADLPKNVRLEPSLIAIYVRWLIQFEENAKAQKIIEEFLDRDWDNHLAALYGDIEFEDPSKALKKAEKWLDSHPESPELLVSVARLCIKNKLWGKARSLLEHSLVLKPSPRGYQALAELHEQLEELEEAKLAYKKGFRLLVERDSVCP